MNTGKDKVERNELDTAEEDRDLHAEYAAEEFYHEHGYRHDEKLSEQQKINRYFGLPKDGLVVDKDGKALRNEDGQLVDENGKLIVW